MKNWVLLPFAVILAFSFKASTSYKVETGASSVVWMGYKVTGKHTGTVKIKSGTLEFTDGKLTDGAFEMDMTSITCTDLEGEWAGKLVSHLKSDDFLGVNSFPTASMDITRVIPQDSKGNYKVKANLTIKGKTNEITFFVNAIEKDGTVNATGKMTIDRSQYDMKYGSGSFFDNLGDKTIYDEFDLQVSLVAKK